MEEIDRFYILYLKALRSSYENIVSHFKEIAQKCVNEKNKKEISFIMVKSFFF